jgi:pimeloyl-ACP methyl ester carboxylesterase
MLRLRASVIALTLRAEVTCDTELFQYFHTTYRMGVAGLRSDFLDSRAVADWFSRNEPGQRPSSGPILLMQGAHDTLVPADATTALAEELCLNGDAVDYQLLTGADHDAVIYQSYEQVRAWLRDRFAGLPAASTCQ